MNADRVHSYLQVACAGLGFDIGEVWWMSNENDVSTVASIKNFSSTASTPADDSSCAGSGSSSAGAPSHDIDNTDRALTDETLQSSSIWNNAPPKKRFLQLYTSKAYCNQRSKLVQPHDGFDEKIHLATSSSEMSSTSQLTLLQKNNSNINSSCLTEEDEHVLSPRIVEAVTLSTQIVWANCQKSEGLLGRSDVKLQTAIGLPVGVDDSGNVWVVVMFSPNNVESSTDALDFLQYISRCAASTSIPCLLPVVGEPIMRKNERESKMMENMITDTSDHDKVDTLYQQSQSQNHYLVCMKPNLKQTDRSCDILGEGVTAKFVSFNINDDNDMLNLSNQPRRSSVNDLQNALIDDFGIPILPSSLESDPYSSSFDEDGVIADVVTDAFDEASYGIWSTIMNSASGETIRTSTTIASKMDMIRERLEEFASAFLGMSVFDVADAWILSAIDGEVEEFAEERESVVYTRTLKCLFTVAATELNPGINLFREVCAHASIQVGDGAVGKAFSLGYPLWSSDKECIYDRSRYDSFQNCRIETAFAVPIFSAGDVSPSCILSCYSLVPTDSVQFVINFVQKAVRLLWDGLDQVVNPHVSVGKELWNNVRPFDLGEMAADLEMQKEFIGKKRPFSDVSPRQAKLMEHSNYESGEQSQNSIQSAQINNRPELRMQSPTNALNSSNYLSVQGLGPAPLLPNSLIAPKSHQLVFVDFSGDGHSSLQQPVQYVADDPYMNTINNNNDFSVIGNHFMIHRCTHESKKRRNLLSHHQTVSQQELIDGTELDASQQAQQDVRQCYLMSQLLKLDASPVNTDTSRIPQNQHDLVNPIETQKQWLLQHENNFTETKTSQSQHQPQLQTYHTNEIPLTYVDYRVQSQSFDVQPLPPRNSTAYMNDCLEILPNVIEFDVVIPMHSTSDNQNSSLSIDSMTIPFTSTLTKEEITSNRVTPVSPPDKAIMRTDHKTLYCSTYAQAVSIESMDQSMFTLNDFKKCRIEGCIETATLRRPYCIKHCGVRQCESVGCIKHAQGATRFCIAHGGGRRCTFLGCDKGARDKFFCAAHGGGKRCRKDGCIKSAVGGSQLCTSHGGGKRCKVEGCDKSAQSSTDFCVKHGGGKKCLYVGCGKVSRGKTSFCAAHGGGVRCKLDGCNRVAIGKVQLCRAHGGGANSRFKPLVAHEYESLC